MIPLEALQAVKRVIVHGPGCPDGVASALILKDALPDVQVTFMQYDSVEHRELVLESGMLFCDFSPYIPLYGETREDGTRDEYFNNLWAWSAVGTIVLDHHPTRRDVTEAFGDLGVFGENDRGECGAWLAYEHVWKRLADEHDLVDDFTCSRVRYFAELAAVRDTWKKDDPRWREACEQAALLLFWPFEKLSLEDVLEQHYLGSVLFEKQLEAARRSLDEAYRFRTAKGTSVCMFQGVSTTSDAAEIAHARGEDVDIVVGFHYRAAEEEAGRFRLQFSMRSHTGYDVGAFAKAHGGGGHAAAAGFTVDADSASPYDVFWVLLEDWEKR